MMSVSAPPVVLVIEDEPDLAQTLRYNLEKAGYTARVALTGAEGERLARDPEQRPSLILLDIMLPDTSGFELCRVLKEDVTLNAVPVLMLTARGEEADRVQGFEVGAEDYVLKPFSVRELLLRVQALLKRAQREGDPLSSPPDRGEEHAIETLIFGELTLSLISHQTFVSEVEVALTLLEFKLLKTLIERKGRTQSRAALLRDVWGIEVDLSTRTVDTHVKRLREKLGQAGVYIQTVRGIGYRFARKP
jgi:two-component system phosphate regulon response regulator PhoB